jgi:hypothetical protein
MTSFWILSGKPSRRLQKRNDDKGHHCGIKVAI